MSQVLNAGNIMQIGENVRIETGPIRKVAKATLELLDNEVTASHYQPDALDAVGQPIELGSDMTYLDWNGHQLGTEGATGYYVYGLRARTADERKALEIADDATDPDQTHVWAAISCEADEAAAITAATNYLLAQG